MCRMYICVCVNALCASVCKLLLESVRERSVMGKQKESRAVIPLLMNDS